MDILVKYMYTDKEFLVTLQPSDEVATVKAYILRKTGIPVDEQILTFEGSTLKDDWKLYDPKHEGWVLDLELYVRGRTKDATDMFLNEMETKLMQKISSVAAPALPQVNAQEEKRAAPNGVFYTMQQFIDYYGDTCKWEAAEDQLASSSQDTFEAPAGPQVKIFGEILGNHGWVDSGDKCGPTKEDQKPIHTVNMHKILRVLRDQGSIPVGCKVSNKWVFVTNIYVRGDLLPRGQQNSFLAE